MTAAIALTIMGAMPLAHAATSPELTCGLAIRKRQAKQLVLLSKTFCDGLLSQP